MLLSGSYKELRLILDRAIAIQADVIYFVFPNHAVCVPKQGEYAYFRTTLFMSHSAMLSQTSIASLRKFFRTVTKHRTRTPQSPYYNVLMQSVAIREMSVEFDKNKDFTYELETKFIAVPQASELTQKMESLGTSSFNSPWPYLKLKPELIKAIYSRFTPYGVDLAEQNIRANLNMFTSENNQLVFTRGDVQYDQSKCVKDPSPQYFESDYVLYHDFHHVSFPLYDYDIVTMHKLIRMGVVDTVVLIPFDNFYIIEGHSGDLVFKFHSKYAKAKLAPQP